MEAREQARHILRNYETHELEDVITEAVQDAERGARIAELEAELERREILIRDVLYEWGRWDEATPIDAPLRRLASHMNKYLPAKEA
jgi:hypothetical protein